MAGSRKPRSLHRGSGPSSYLPTPTKSEHRGRSRERRNKHTQTDRSVHMRDRSRSSSAKRSRSGNRAVNRENRTGNVHGVFERLDYTLSLGKHTARQVKGTGRWKYNDQFYGVIASSEGKQGYGWIGRTCFAADMFRSIAGVPSEQSSGRFGTQNPLFNQNPWQKITGPSASVVGVSAGDTFANDFINLHSVDLHYSFSNFANTACILDIWVLRYKTNTFRSPQDIWSEALKAENAGSTPASNAGATLGVYYSAGMGYPTPDIVGQNPFSCSAFKKTFKLLKHQTFDMAADTNIEMHLRINYNKYLSKEYMIALQGTAGDENNMNYKSTVVLMYRVRGQVVCDSSITGSKNPSIGNTEVGYTCNRVYTCSSAPGGRYKIQSAMPWLIGTNSLSTETIVNVVDAAATVAELV